MFKPEEILRFKQYERMFTSGLIHLDWWHFAFNAFSLWSFGRLIELVYGRVTFLVIYLASILGGSLLSLFIHRREAGYRALGASGGVCGILFASIFLLPGGSVYLMFIPFAIPAYAFAVLYLLYTFFGLRRRAGNIGHDAHLGGALVGLLVATAIYPQLIFAQPLLFAVVMGLSVVMLLVLGLDPMQLLKQRARSKPDSGFIGDERERRYYENRVRNEKLAEVDRLLDRVSRHGVQSLSPDERQRLARLSKEIERG